jgi:hypothetical protein
MGFSWGPCCLDILVDRGRGARSAGQPCAGGYPEIIFQRASSLSGLAGMIFTMSASECLPTNRDQNPVKKDDSEGVLIIRKAR